MDRRTFVSSAVTGTALGANAQTSAPSAPASSASQPQLNLQEAVIALKSNPILRKDTKLKDLQKFAKDPGQVMGTFCCWSHYAIAGDYRVKDPLTSVPNVKISPNMTLDQALTQMKSAGVIDNKSAIIFSKDGVMSIGKN